MSSPDALNAHLNLVLGGLDLGSQKAWGSHMNPEILREEDHAGALALGMVSGGKLFVSRTPGKKSGDHGGISSLVWLILHGSHLACFTPSPIPGSWQRKLVAYGGWPGICLQANLNAREGYGR